MSSPADQPYAEFMAEALREAELAEAEGEVPVGSVVVYRGAIIARAHNTREREQDATGHAELTAMRRAMAHLGSWRLTGCTVIVTLEPCAMCAGAMVQARVDRCVFGASDPKAGFVGSLADLSSFTGLNHRFEVVAGVQAEDSARLLRRFFRGLRRRSEEG